ncbi:MAG TPA: hypothetical protein VMT00_03375, partial [Thermoanaerobaculia bacterium]|nr:hypothetical protein [Thermoanaerobaculia bacterium]
MNEIAEGYVKLVLAVGEHDSNYVDAYYGPENWKIEVAATKPGLEEIRTEANRLLAELYGMPDEGDEISKFRRRFLTRHLQSLIARVIMLEGKELTFDEESWALYDAVAPAYPESYYKAILARLEAELPGPGALAERYEAFRRDFVIPVDRLDTVFQTAINACRERTLPNIPLPPGESFTVEYVKDKSWSGYNWYQGGYRSLIQVNIDLPIYIDRAIDLACHEGYPGHHLYNALLEKNLVVDRGWQEFSVYPLNSPMSLIAEGSANYGIEVAFPGNERVEYEKRELFPLAGIDPAKADRYYRIHNIVRELAYAGNEAARRYLNGEITADQAAEWLTTYTLSEPARAKQRVRFFDTYRSYVINYNLGKDLVRRHIEARGGTDDNPQKRWEEFERL